MINQFFNFGFLFSYLFLSASAKERIVKGGGMLNPYPTIEND